MLEIIDPFAQSENFLFQVQGLLIMVAWRHCTMVHALLVPGTRRSQTPLEDRMIHFYTPPRPPTPCTPPPTIRIHPFSQAHHHLVSLAWVSIFPFCLLLFVISTNLLIFRAQQILKSHFQVFDQTRKYLRLVSPFSSILKSVVWICLVHRKIFRALKSITLMVLLFNL